MNKIEQWTLSAIKPYENNPRINEGAVKGVAKSIEAFGFRNPIIVDRDGVIVCGHTRYKAAKALDLKTVPVLVVDDLTDEQVRAYRLADNKTAEAAFWDDDLLAVELEDLTDCVDFDMADFGFDLTFPEIEDDGYYGDERERTYESMNLNDFDEERTAGFYDMPILKPCGYVPKDLIGFNYVKTSTDYDKGVHFFIDDYQFERIWNDPQRNIERLRQFDCVLTPDFSLYMDMPMAMKIWNVYRSRLIGQMCQDAGLKVIPTLSWAEPATYQFCFDGIEPGGTVAVSTVGVMRDAAARAVWADGMREALSRLRPRHVVCYGSQIDFDFKGVPVSYVKARQFGE